MIRKLPVFALLILMLLPGSVFGQVSGKIIGYVTDRTTKEPLPYVAVRVYSGGQMKGQAVADESGYYSISPLNPGTYELHFDILSHHAVKVNGVAVYANTSTRYNTSMADKAVEGEEVEVTTYKKPLISTDQPTTIRMNAEDLEKLPTRDIRAAIATQGQIFSNDDGGDINIKGNGSDANITYVNGVRYNSRLLPPVETIAEISVIVGGVPSQFGDALGGVISLTTKGAASKYHGGVQYETSSLFDKYNYNLVGANFSGPLVRKKTVDPITKDSSTRTLLGFYGAYTYNYQADAFPSAYGYLKVKDDVLKRVEETPLVRYEGVNGEPNYRYALDFLGPDDFVRVQARPNSASSQHQFNMTLDYQPKDNIIISVGGNFNYGAARNIFYNGIGARASNSNFNWFNSDFNNYGSSTDYNGFVRFRQSFQNLGGDSGFGVKNLYYQLQADYSRVYNLSQDPRYTNHQELYNYWGKFSERRVSIPAPAVAGESGQFYVYQPGTSRVVDSINVNPGLVDGIPTRYEVRGTTITQGLPGGFDYTPYSNAGPIANINNQIIATETQTNPDFGLFTPFGLAAVGGLINGSGSGLAPAYGLGIAAPGELQSSYGWTNNEQYRVSGQVGGEIGKHNIKLGFEYEQRVNRTYGAGGLWGMARRLVNTQIISSPARGTSLSNFTTTYDADGTRVITIDPDLAVNTDGEGNVLNQTNYDKRLRQILGLPNNSLINVDQLDPSLVGIRNFTPNEMIGDGSQVTSFYQGASPYGDIAKRSSFYDFFTDTVNRPIDAFRPIYMAGYIEDKFEINDLVLRAGIRVDQFDINQPVLRDNYSLTRLTYAGETDLSKFRNQSGGNFVKPSNIGDDYAVYLDHTSDEGVAGNESNYTIQGFRKGNQYYNSQGQEITDYRQIASNGSMFPLYDLSRLSSSEKALQRSHGITLDAFQDFKPQTNIMPRLAFTFPLSEEASFFAHYDVLTQRPLGMAGNSRSGPITFDNYASPLQYYQLIRQAGSAFVNNPGLNPQKKIDYQMGFQQALNSSTAMKLSFFYSEIKDLIQVVNVLGGYPNAGYRTNGNIDFGVVKGTSISFDFRKKRNSGFGANASYTLQFAEGSASDFAQALLNTSTPNLRVINPQNWDQRHAFKLNIDYRIGKGEGFQIAGYPVLENAGINMTTYLGSGQPYTIDGGPWGGRSQIEGSINGARLPWNNRTGMRIDKTITFKPFKSSETTQLNVYLYVQNLFNQKNTLDVYRKTGRPDDDGYLASQYGQNYIATNYAQYSPETYIYYYQQLLLDPNNVSLPRRWRIGMTYSF